MSIKNTVIANIRRLRKQKGLTQAELAELIDASHSHIRQVETGQSGFSIESIEKIATALEVPVAMIFEDEVYRNSIQRWREAAWELAQTKIEKVLNSVDNDHGFETYIMPFRNLLKKDVEIPLNTGLQNDLEKILRQIASLGPEEIEILKDTLESLSKPMKKIAKEKKA